MFFPYLWKSASYPQRGCAAKQMRKCRSAWKAWECKYWLMKFMPWEAILCACSGTEKVCSIRVFRMFLGMQGCLKRWNRGWPSSGFDFVVAGVILLGLTHPFLVCLMKPDVETPARKDGVIIWAVAPMKCLVNRLESICETSYVKIGSVWLLTNCIILCVAVYFGSQNVFEAKGEELLLWWLRVLDDQSSTRRT